jgi:RNA polymerase sigma-70 factor, ECF subfamily
LNDRRSPPPPPGERPNGSGFEDIPKGRRIVLCLVPRDLADELHDPLREHFRDRADVEVIIERRSGDERRSTADRRQRGLGPPARGERRRPRKLAERRLAERRAPPSEAEPPPLPDWAQPFLDRLSFVARFEPLVLEREDVDTGRLVERIQAGDRGSVERLYERYFHRVYGYLRPVAADSHEAEILAQQVFVRTLEALSRYKVRGESFRAWLFAAVRDEAIAAFRRDKAAEGVTIVEPERDAERAEPFERSNFAWMTERELSRRFERLPEDQRQVLAVRELLDLSVAESAHALGRSEPDVRSLQSRALGSMRGPVSCP